MADTEHAGRCIHSTKTAIENKPFILLSDRVATSFPLIGRLDFEAILTPEYPAPMSANRLREKFFEVWKIDLRQILTNLLKIETRHASKQLASRLDNVAPT